jgi:hypothetical protein
MNKKRVLLVHFSQTGQLARVARTLTAPLAQAHDVELVEEVLRPVPPYPFPWPAWRFLDAMPESVLLDPPQLEPLTLPANAQFDLVVLAYQVWFLAPAGPIVAFLKSEAGHALVRGRPVITVVACRNMWLTAHETMKRLVAEAGGELRDNVVLTDQSGTLASFITTPRWLLTGKRDAFWGLPAAGVADADIAATDRFGNALVAALRAGRERAPGALLAGLGAAKVDPNLVFSERAGSRAFRAWSRIIRLGGGPRGLGRLPLLALFCVYLVVMIIVVVPPSLLLQRLLRPFFRRGLQSEP